ncbi:B12-binding domain-containing radical SAM protein [Cyclobacterium sp.]|uniref:B12-binding domain-containing radical SAM protein n=1 Tax=Cyclobacterium sp. TaxID=1966343 RepID=UPI0019B5B6B9|nr:B12-binding domain-containing radical SAM protein [Cyclobacterium sp.]MBD3630291.1 radical SAM protein [Cyclobacterium sp.]
MKDLLLITPPFTQLNTPYPGTAYLKGFLNTRNISSFQMDLGIEVILAIFSKHGLKGIFSQATKEKTIDSENAGRIFALREHYLHTIDGVIRFLQGRAPTFARQLCSENFLPRASRFEQLDDLDEAFGHMGMQDRAKHLATLYLEDLSDFIIECIDPHFGFSRYAERLGKSANSFDELYLNLQQKPTYIDQISLAILDQRIRQFQPKMICFSVPFPGNLYSALRCGAHIKAHFNEIKIAMGGGFPNTELRSLTDPRVFEYVDFISLDDGEKPIELLVEHVLHPAGSTRNIGCLKRTFVLDQGKVFYNNLSDEKDYRQSELGTPDYSDLFLDQYISVIEIANPMHSLWTDGRWNKLTMAHGCYWGKCTFCDISLDYIKIYEPIAANILVDRMEQLMHQTGDNGFHFVDEAAPPALMRAVALEILKRKLTVTWWTNIRFEKSFSRDLCLLLKASGCIAVSGGLEVASDRLLKLIDKGVTVAQVAQVTRNFTEAGIMVHAYLMYGYPTQTVQETIDSLEMVRQLFESGVLQSGFWHQFAMTAHSPVGLHPEAFQVIPDKKAISFANNDIAFEDESGIDHQIFSQGLKTSLYNYMHGVGYDFPLQDWFDFEIPFPGIEEHYIADCLEAEDNFSRKQAAKMVWLGNPPEITKTNRKGERQTFLELTFHSPSAIIDFTLEESQGRWLVAILEKLARESKLLTFAQFKESFEETGGIFERFWTAEFHAEMRECGLLMV